MRPRPRVRPADDGDAAGHAQRPSAFRRSEPVGTAALRIVDAAAGPRGGESAQHVPDQWPVAERLIRIVDVGTGAPRASTRTIRPHTLAPHGPRRTIADRSAVTHSPAKVGDGHRRRVEQGSRTDSAGYNVQPYRFGPRRCRRGLARSDRRLRRVTWLSAASSVSRPSSSGGGRRRYVAAVALDRPKPFLSLTAGIPAVQKRRAGRRRRALRRRLSSSARNMATPGAGFENPRGGISETCLILEPAPRRTAPAIALAVLAGPARTPCCWCCRATMSSAMPAAFRGRGRSGPGPRPQRTAGHVRGASPIGPRPAMATSGAGTACSGACERARFVEKPDAEPPRATSPTGRLPVERRHRSCSALALSSPSWRTCPPSAARC